MMTMVIEVIIIIITVVAVAIVVPFIIDGGIATYVLYAHRATTIVAIGVRRRRRRHIRILSTSPDFVIS